MILIYITCKDKKEAKKIGLYLVKQRMAACCNIFPIKSIYHWEKKVVFGKETVLIVKTLESNFNQIEKEVRKLHSYTVPCILKIPIKVGNKEYLEWLEKEVK
jgi:periplasmic divalent cation tolerance protein